MDGTGNNHNNNHHSDNNQRIGRVFEKFQSLHNSLQDEKANKFKVLVSLFTTFEKTLQEMQETKAEKLQSIVQKLSALDRQAAQESVNRDRNTSIIAEALLKADKTCKNHINVYVKDRVEKQRKLEERINGLLKKCRSQLEATLENESLGELAKYEAMIPPLQEELAYQSQLRVEIQEKIYSQFADQINELKQMFEQERREREEQHERIMKILKQVYSRFMEQVKKEQHQREQNEALLLGVIEQLVDKIASGYYSF